VAGSADRPRREPAGAPIGAVIREFLAQPRLRRGLALGRLAGSWDQVVGSRLAEETEPVSLEAGRLVVAATTAAWAAQVRFLARDVARRADQVLGSEEVRSVAVVVSSEARKALRRKGSGG
jgi:predicted nucleic acid-binding Zn ribbon protein